MSIEMSQNPAYRLTNKLATPFLETHANTRNNGLDNIGRTFCLQLYMCLQPLQSDGVQTCIYLTKLSSRREQ